MPRRLDDHRSTLHDRPALFVEALDAMVAAAVAFVFPAIVRKCGRRDADGRDCDEDLLQHGCSSFSMKPRRH
jgi:hypothetical protein